MSDSAQWTYIATTHSSHSSAPSLSLTTSSPTLATKSTRFAASTLRVDVHVLTEDNELQTDGLVASALAGEVREWFNSHKHALNLDSVGAAQNAEAGFSIHLDAFSSSARCSALAANPSSNVGAAGDLDELNLRFAFRSPSSASSGQPASQLQAHSQDFPQSPVVTLASQLLHPTSLHFSLSALVSSALLKVAKKLVKAYPLCFNRKWIDRLSSDKTAHQAIASSLSNILNLDSSTAAPLPSDIEAKAALLNLTLATRFSPSRSPSSGDSPAGAREAAPSINSKDALGAALVVLAREASAPDAWPANAVSQDGGGVGEAKKSGGRSRKRGRVEPDEVGKADKGKGKGKKRRTRVDQPDSDELADFAFPALSSSTLRDKTSSSNDDAAAGQRWLRELDGVGVADEADNAVVVDEDVLFWL
ncbi:hypothetical protein JCM10207_006155 [Rhodosporidiobolus poonsookiae]